MEVLLSSYHFDQFQIPRSLRQPHDFRHTLFIKYSRTIGLNV